METILKIMECENEIFYDDDYECKTSKFNKFYDNFELIQYMLENDIKPLKVHEDLIDAFEIELKDWIELYEDGCDFQYDNIEKLQALIHAMRLCEKL